MPGLALESAVRTDRGLVRSVNEDCVFASPRMAVVADGVGGSAAGEVASAVAMNELILMDKSRLSGPLDEALADAVAPRTRASALSPKLGRRWRA